MATKRITMRALAGLTLWAGFGLGPAGAAPPAPPADKMAGVMPKQPGVTVATPAAADFARYRVDPYPTADKPVGYVLYDASNRPVRRFVAAGTADFNILSFYQDGQEVYRETDTKGTGRTDQFRWLGVNGSKTGWDLDGNGTIDTWDVISPEEVSREVVDAILKNDAARLSALLPTANDLKAVGLPQPEIDKILARAGGAVKRMQDTAAALKLTDKAKWIHLELWTPETTPADAFGGKADVVRHRNAGVLVDKGDGKNAEVFQLGELVLVGKAWKLIDGPATGSPSPGSDAVAGGPNPIDIPGSIKALVDKMQKLTKPDEMAAKAGVLEEIVAVLQKANDPQQADWLKQLIDAHTAAAEAGDKGSSDRLAAWKKQIDTTAPKSPLAGFAAFRLAGVEYAARLKNGPEAKQIAETQKWWRDTLEAFVKDYPNLEETPEALFRLAMATEFAGKDGEAAAKGHYATLAKNFPQHPLAAQAAGAVRRLDSEGQPLQLSGPSLTGGPAINVASQAGKVVIVYYWAGWYSQLKPEAAAMTEIMRKHAGKVEVLTVCLDANPQDAVRAINAVSLPGQHLFAPNGSLATAYGVMGPHIFVVGKDGKVANKSGQAGTLADEVDRLVK